MRIQKMRKIRVNLTLEPETLKVLSAMKLEINKTRRKKMSISSLIDYVVRTKCADSTS